MISFELKDLKPIHLLQNAYGIEIELEESHNGIPTIYRILAEFCLGETNYGVLQNNEQRLNDEVDLFYIHVKDSGEVELETIMDDDEWEAVAELYDELTVNFDDEA